MPTLPTEFTLVSADSLTIATPVTSDPVADIGENSNYAWGAYSGDVLHAVFSSPVRPDGADPAAQDLLVIPVPPSADRRNLVVKLFAENPGYVDTLRIEYDGDPTVFHTEVLGAASSTTEYTFTLSEGRNVDDVLLVRSMTPDDARIHSISAWWALKRGISMDYAPVPSGHRFSAAHEWASGRAMTDEMLNRWLTNPRHIFRDRPTCVACGFAGLRESPPRWRTRETARSCAFVRYTDVRYKCDIRWRAFYTGPTGVGECAVIVRDVDGGEEVDLGDAQVTALPATGGPYPINSALLSDVEPGLHRFEVWIESNAVDWCNLYALTGWVEVAA